MSSLAAGTSKTGAKPLVPKRSASGTKKLLVGSISALALALAKAAASVLATEVLGGIIGVTLGGLLETAASLAALALLRSSSVLAAAMSALALATLAAIEAKSKENILITYYPT